MKISFAIIWSALIAVASTPFLAYSNSANAEKIPSCIPPNSEKVAENDSLIYYRSLIAKGADECSPNSYSLWIYDIKRMKADELFRTPNQFESIPSEWENAGFVIPISQIPICEEIKIPDYEKNLIVVQGYVYCRFPIAFLVDVNKKKATFLGCVRVNNFTSEDGYIVAEGFDYVGLPECGGRYDVYYFFNMDGKEVTRHDLFKPHMLDDSIMLQAFFPIDFSTDMDLVDAEKNNPKNKIYDFMYRLKYKYPELHEKDIALLDSLCTQYPQIRKTDSGYYAEDTLVSISESEEFEWWRKVEIRINYKGGAEVKIYEGDKAKANNIKGRDDYEFFGFLNE